VGEFDVQLRHLMLFACALVVLLAIVATVEYSTVAQERLGGGAEAKREQHWYVPSWRADLTVNDLAGVWLTMLLLFKDLLPYPLLITAQLARAAQGALVAADSALLGGRVLRSGRLEALGDVRLLVADKDTLTRNTEGGAFGEALLRVLVVEGAGGPCAARPPPARALCRRRRRARRVRPQAELARA
jgi:hypothetical protein